MKRLLMLFGVLIILGFNGCKKEDPCAGGEISTPEVSAGGSTVFCEGGSVLLSTGTEDNLHYQWQKDGVEIGSATSSSYIATSGGEYQVRINKGDCTKQKWSAPVKVIVNTGVMAAITPSGPVLICKGSKITLYGNSCKGYTYQWKKNTEYIQGAIDVNFEASEAGDYQLQVTEGSENAWSGIVTVNLKDCE